MSCLFLVGFVASSLGVVNRCLGRPPILEIVILYTFVLAQRLSLAQGCTHQSCPQECCGNGTCRTVSQVCCDDGSACDTDCCGGSCPGSGQLCCGGTQIYTPPGEACCDLCNPKQKYNTTSQCCTPSGPVTKCGDPSDNWGVSVTVDADDSIFVCKGDSKTLHFSASITGTPPRLHGMLYYFRPNMVAKPNGGYGCQHELCGDPTPYTFTATAQYTCTAIGNCPCATSGLGPKQGSKTVSVTVAEIYTETVAVLPNPRTRKKVGVGEQVFVTRHRP